MITRRRAKMTTRDKNSESQEQEFDINNQLGMDRSENNTVESDINVTASEENNQSRALGQESEPREMNFNMLMEFIKQQNEEMKKEQKNILKERMKSKENLLKKPMKNKENRMKKCTGKAKNES